MEFNKIQLPPYVVAGLYRHSLVLLDEETKNSGNPKEPVNEIAVVGTSMPIATDINQVTANTSVNKADNSVANNILRDGEPTTSIGSNTMIDNNEISSIGKAILANEEPDVSNQPLNTMHIKYLGGFNKKISIVLAEHFQPHISDGDLAFLGKLLQACQLSLNDVAIINVVSNAPLLNKLWQLMPAEKMILFDVDPGTLGLSFRMQNFQVQPWNDCLFLIAPSLQDLQEGPQEKLLLLKRKLWDSLKKMFAL